MTEKTTSSTVATRIRLLGDRVLCRRRDAQDRSQGGIILPDDAKEKPFEGTVLAVGPGKVHAETGVRTPTTVKPGDRVLYTSYQALEVTIDDEALLVVAEDAIMAIIG